jgi:uncharacterized protein
MADRFDADLFRSAMGLYAEVLADHREELDSLNVYPVPDGDTGTNMLLTQQAVESALAADGRPETTWEVTASASLMGARGNSGVILSQVLRGLCDVLRIVPDGATGDDLARALRHSSDEAYRAVAQPAEGTVLTVLRDGAAAAEAGTGEVADVLTRALEAARHSLARTRETLPELRQAGVVDAGGKGIVLLLDALLAAVRSERPSEPVGPLGPVGAPEAAPQAPLAFPFEVQYVLHAEEDAVPELRRALAELGDSLVLVGGGGEYRVHVHTDRPDDVLAVAQRTGRTHDVSVVNLEGQADECATGPARAVQVAEQASGLVAVAEGPGLIRAFRSLGAVVVAGGPGNNPSVGALVEAVERAPGASVLMLPNHPNVIPAAEGAAGEASKEVHVVPAGSIVAGIAAATAFDPLAGLEANAGSSDEAARSVRSGELVPAVRDADTPAGPVKRGGWLAIAGGRAVAAGLPVADSAVTLLRSLAGDGAELVTLVVGADASEEDVTAVRRALKEAFPGLELEVLDGGQPRYPFLIGVE